MKRACLVVFMFLAACAPRVPENEFHIEGRIAGLRDGAVITLYKMDGNLGRGIDTDTVAGGRFSFVVPMTADTRLDLSGYGNEGFPSMGREIRAVPGEKATVTGDSTLIYTWKVKSRVVQQREIDAYMLTSEEEYIRMQQVMTEQNKARNITDPNLRRRVMDSLSTLEEELDLATMRNGLALMARTPVSEVWLDEFSSTAKMIGLYEEYAVLRDDAVAIYEKLTPHQRELPVVQGIGHSLFPPEKVDTGDRMADAELRAFDGTTHKISDYLGRYIILDFWGSGCAPCYQSMPELKALGEKYPDTLKIIGINLDTTEEGWKYGTERFAPSYLNLNAPPASDIDERYGVNGIPHFVIISPEGEILLSWSGYGAGTIERHFAIVMNNTK